MWHAGRRRSDCSKYPLGGIGWQLRQNRGTTCRFLRRRILGVSD
jgi:hypothetical protein